MQKKSITLIMGLLWLTLVPSTVFPKSDPKTLPAQPPPVALNSNLTPETKQQILEAQYQGTLKDTPLPKIPTEITPLEGYTPVQIEHDTLPVKLDRFKKPVTLLEAAPVPLEKVLEKIARMINVDLVIKEDVDRRLAVKPEIKGKAAYKAIRDILSRLGCSYRLNDTVLTVFKFEQRRFNLVMGPIDYKHRSTISSENKTTTSSSESAATSTTSEKSKMGSSTHVESNLELNFWQELDTNLAKMVSKEGWYSMNKSEGVVVAKDYPAVLDEISKYLDTVNSCAARQVLVQAQILEVNLSKSHAWGIDWNTLYQGYGNVKQVSTGISLIQDVVDSNSLSITGSGRRPGAGVTAKGVQGVLEALEKQGEVNIVSQPKILLLNNIPGKIQVVKKTPYISQVTQTIYGTNNETSFSVQTDEVLQGVIMEMSAMILDKDNIYLNLTPIVKDLADTAIPEKSFGNITVQLPQTTDRALTTTIKVKSGETVVIGGLIQNSEKNDTRRVPIISKIPLLGKLFKSESKTKEKTEIVVMITPTLVD